MSKSEGKIAKNATYLTIASIIQKIISFGYYGFLANAIGNELLGKYDAALKFTSIFIIFMDFGLGPLLTREGAKSEKKLQQYVNVLFSIKIVLIIVTLIVMIPSAHVYDLMFERVDALDVRLIYVGALIILFDTLNFTFFSIFRALKQMIWEAFGVILYQAVILGSGFAAIQAGLPLEFILAALLAGSVVQFVYLCVILFRKSPVRFTFTWDWQLVKKYVRMAAPFAIAGILFRLNGTADSLMLKVMAGDGYAGWYGLAFKLTFALTVLPGAFATSYFPVVSEYFKHAQEKLHMAFENGVVYMLALSFPIVAGVFVLGDDIILSVWEQDWSASIQPLLIFMIGLPFIFANYPVGNFLNAVNRQAVNTMNMMIALVVNIALNALLIPYYTFNGAAIAAVASSIVLVALGIPWVYKVAPFRISFFAKKTALIGLSAAMMGGVLYFVQYTYPLLVLIPLGAVLYVASLFLLGAFTRAEIQGVLSSIMRRK